MVFSFDFLTDGMYSKMARRCLPRFTGHGVIMLLQCFRCACLRRLTSMRQICYLSCESPSYMTVWSSLTNVTPVLIWRSPFHCWSRSTNWCSWSNLRCSLVSYLLIRWIKGWWYYGRPTPSTPWAWALSLFVQMSIWVAHAATTIHRFRFTSQPSQCG